MQPPSWVDTAVWWHVFPLGFTGAPAVGDPSGPVVHRLPALHPWLDYLVELGCNGLLLGPVLAAASHGYDTVDHFRIDPRLGDESDLVDLVEACHARGIRVGLDGVFNHVGRDHPAFREAVEGGRAEWFRPIRDRDGGTAGFEVFEGHEGLVVLDHGSAAVRQLAVDVMTYWCARGVDAWRLDAAYAVPPSFWAAVLPAVRDRYPETWFVGEVIHGDYAAFAEASTLESLTQYELWKALWSSVNDKNLFELAWALQRHDEFQSALTPLTFVGNHDVTRIASMLTDIRFLPHVLAVWLTVGGVPSVYYGDEQAYRGVKEERLGGDDQVRPVFPPSPSELSLLGRDTAVVHRELLGLRRRHPWLVRARTTTLLLENETLAFRSAVDGRGLVTAVHLGSTAVRVPVEAAGEVLAGREARVSGGELELGPCGWAVLG